MLTKQFLIAVLALPQEKWFVQLNHCKSVTYNNAIAGAKEIQRLKEERREKSREIRASEEVGAVRREEIRLEIEKRKRIAEETAMLDIQAREEQDRIKNLAARKHEVDAAHKAVQEELEKVADEMKLQEELAAGEESGRLEAENKLKALREKKKEVQQRAVAVASEAAEVGDKMSALVKERNAAKQELKAERKMVRVSVFCEVNE